jgi:hypothetical protein
MLQTALKIPKLLVAVMKERSSAANELRVIRRKSTETSKGSRVITLIKGNFL